MLSILVSKLGLLVFELLLGNEPEVVDSQTLIVVLARSHFFLFDGAFECTTLVPHRLLVLFVVVVVDRVSTGQGFLLSIELLVGPTGWVLLGRHID